MHPNQPCADETPNWWIMSHVFKLWFEHHQINPFNHLNLNCFAGWGFFSWPNSGAAGGEVESLERYWRPFALAVRLLLSTSPGHGRHVEEVTGRPVASGFNSEGRKGSISPQWHHVTGHCLCLPHSCSCLLGGHEVTEPVQWGTQSTDTDSNVASCHSLRRLLGHGLGCERITPTVRIA